VPVAPAIGVAVVALVAAWFVVRPLRADLLARRAADQIRVQDLAGARASLESATSLAPWNGSYWADLASTEVLSGDVTAAVAAGRRAVQAQPGVARYEAAVGDLEVQAGHLAAAARWWDRARHHDRYNVSLWQDAADWAALRRPALAPRWYRQALALDPSNEAFAKKAARWVGTAPGG
jgi:tetratricopeptide (TPR) repeat protein